MDSPGSTLPPPSPPDPAPSRTPLVALTVAGFVAAAVLGVLWLVARNDANDLAAERDALVTERDLANERNVELDTELQVAQNQLETAQQELADATSGADEPGEPDQSVVDALEDEVAELRDEVDRLRTENETLAADLDAAQTATPPTTAAALPTTSTAPATTAAPVDAPEPLSAAQIGNRIAGLYRDDVLGPGQELCIGQIVSDELGAGVVTAILAGDDPGSDESLVTSIRGATFLCGIDPSAVFGN